MTVILCFLPEYGSHIKNIVSILVRDVANSHTESFSHENEINYFKFISLVSFELQHKCWCKIKDVRVRDTTAQNFKSRPLVEI
jgi:hypothetical protein